VVNTPEIIGCCNHCKNPGLSLTGHPVRGRPLFPQS
jgi:hypothetical protein